MRQSCNIVLVMAALLGVLSLGACGTKVNEDNYGKLKQGMTMKEVTDILGEPDKKDGGGIGGVSGSVATWEDGDKKIIVTFMNDKVTMFSKSGF